jgi:hypothetical protein
MRPAELVYRVGEQWTLLRLRARDGCFVPAAASSLAFCRATERQLPDLPLDEPAILAKKSDLLDGRWPALGFDWQWRSDPAIWRRAPDTGREWPDVFFGAIAYRAGNPTGDVRVAWEPARLQQLLGLAVIASRGDEPTAGRAVRLFEDQLRSFAAANRPWSGIHYVSAMECALRLIAVSHATDMMRDRLHRAADVWAAVAALASSHAPFIAARLSLHSSAGNHTIAESAALVYAGELFAELPGAARWRERGLDILTTEMQRQVLPDGGGIEQAFWYLLLIADLAGLVVALLDHRRQSVPDALRESLAQARAFLGALAARPADLPPVGDRDDGFALSPALRLNLPATPEAGVSSTFPQSGYSLARMDTAPHYELLFDHGPLGMLPSCGHGHADALSVCLRVAGRDLLIDPGTFGYGGDPRWRSYFRSTAAHNTVMVDGQDQAVQETPFIWSRPYDARLVRSERAAGIFRALAHHDGYRRLSRKVLHWRGVVLRSGCGLLVWDYLDGQGDHAVELRWHVRDDVEQIAGGWLLDAETMLIVDGAGIGTVIEASADGAGGWWSPRYGIREPARTIRTVCTATLPVEFTTRIFPRSMSWPEQQLNQDLETLRTWIRHR